MSELISHVHVYDDRGDTHVFGPGDEVPEWAARKMGAHCFEDGNHPYPEDDQPARQAGTEPPRAGRGSSRDAWAAFASERGVEVEDGATRDDIIAALADAGHVNA